MFIDPGFFSSFLLISSGFIGAFIAALWVALIIWTFRDIRARTRDRFVHSLAAILVALLSVPGVLVYLILRPQRTLEEEYQANLEEEALLKTIEDQILCPGCGRQVKNDWLVCPTCHTKVQKSCSTCEKHLELSWNICPYCGAPTVGLRDERKDVNAKEEEISNEEV